MQFPIRDPENYRRLRSLSTEDAIKHYLEGDFTIGEEAALVEAVQRGLRLPLKSAVIEEVLTECMADETSIDECKQRLIAAAR